MLLFWTAISKFWEIKSFPSAILVSPEGYSLVLPISTENKSFKESVWSNLEDVVSSPKRDEILQNIVKSYCVVLIVRGKDKAENEKARKVVNKAIEQISKLMTQMTRVIEEPPHLIEISPKDFAKEKILLWSLGLNENEMQKTNVIVIYGRGRKIGPSIKGEEITANAILNIFFVVGSACECGLDRRSILGMMLPIRWEKDIQSEVVKSLGFDAESPVVKTEISQILSAGQSFETEDRKSVDDTFYGYREKTIEFQTDSEVATVSPAQFRKMESTKEPEPSKNIFSTYRMTMFIIGGMAIFILTGGLFIIFRNRFKKS